MCVPRGREPPPAPAAFFRHSAFSIQHSSGIQPDEASMDGYPQRAGRIFEQLCMSVDADEAHEQEAIEYFENQFDRKGRLRSRTVARHRALLFVNGVARGITSMMYDGRDDKGREATSPKSSPTTSTYSYGEIRSPSISPRTSSSRSITMCRWTSTRCSTAVSAPSTISTPGPTKRPRRRAVAPARRNCCASKASIELKHCLACCRLFFVGRYR